MDNRTHHIVCLGSEDLPTDDQGESWWKVFWKTDWSSGMKGRSVFQLGNVWEVYNYMSLISGIIREKGGEVRTDGGKWGGLKAPTKLLKALPSN